MQNGCLMQAPRRRAQVFGNFVGEGRGPMKSSSFIGFPKPTLASVSSGQGSSHAFAGLIQLYITRI